TRKAGRCPVPGSTIWRLAATGRCPGRCLRLIAGAYSATAILNGRNSWGGAAMSLTSREYLRATRHPWSSVLFVLPLLITYEAGICLVGARNADHLRNGADTWLRWLLSRAGLAEGFWPGLFLGIGLLVWTWWKRKDRPADLLGVWMGTVTE